MIEKPMLAATVKDVNELKFPLLATPKLDGIRCIIKNGQAVSRTLKPIPNGYISNKLLGLPEGLDGELMLRNGDFNSVQSAIMSEGGSPDFIYNIFDYVKNPNEKYSSRILELKRMFANVLDFIKLIVPVNIYDIEGLQQFENTCISQGYEGIMLRAPDSPYKFGRSTMKEQYLMKLKRFDDSEAEIIGFEEKMSNENEAFEDELGHTKRSSKKEGLVPAGTLGMLQVRDIHNRIEFGLGTGFDDKIRRYIWANKEKLLGKIVNYKYQGIVEKPSFPSFRGFRDERDI